MKTTFLCFLVFLTACAQNVSHNVNSSSIIVVQPTLTSSEKIRKAKSAEEDRQELEKFIENESKDYKLSALRSKNLLNAGFEVRVWRFSAFGDKNLIFVLKQTGENCSAKLIQRTIADKDISKKNPPKKYSTRQLGNPKSGWEILWQKLKDANILTLPNGSEVGNEPSPDSWAFVVETKVENDYRVFEYQSPEHDDSNEAHQMTKIINTISEEFNLNDFNESNFMLP